MFQGKFGTSVVSLNLNIFTWFVGPPGPGPSGAARNVRYRLRNVLNVYLERRCDEAGHRLGLEVFKVRHVVLLPRIERVVPLLLGCGQPRLVGLLVCRPLWWWWWSS